MRVHGYMKNDNKYPKIVFEVEKVEGTNSATPAIRIVAKTYEDREHKAIYYLDSVASSISLIDKLIECVKYLKVENESRMFQLGEDITKEMELNAVKGKND
ncbi:hypothetical protein AKJ65_06170 [candidate division MSBL1 archaeon SCGC-AAA259E19]|uniref:Uncharacterized protein n=1 Tax=candidate division MSBL1 archaeon SCGC-AAA259E19 TaxID=1698264 RepID=A0A133UHD6_9EURY|nr:hypothetical protein AKJ65_06170 [candidate division MSBL1 archaeon SCGC-AAA259E19]